MNEITINLTPLQMLFCGAALAFATPCIGVLLSFWYIRRVSKRTDAHVKALVGDIKSACTSTITLKQQMQAGFAAALGTAEEMDKTFKATADALKDLRGRSEQLSRSLVAFHNEQMNIRDDVNGVKGKLNATAEAIPGDTYIERRCGCAIFMPEDVSLWNVQTFRNIGASDEEILKAFPTLTAARLNTLETYRQGKSQAAELDAQAYDMGDTCGYGVTATNRLKEIRAAAKKSATKPIAKYEMGNHEPEPAYGYVRETETVYPRGYSFLPVWHYHVLWQDRASIEEVCKLYPDVPRDAILFLKEFFMGTAPNVPARVRELIADEAITSEGVKNVRDSLTKLRKKKTDGKHAIGESLDNITLDHVRGYSELPIWQLVVLCGDGATVDEVHELYPNVPTETIAYLKEYAYHQRDGGLATNAAKVLEKITNWKGWRAQECRDRLKNLRLKKYANSKSTPWNPEIESRLKGVDNPYMAYPADTGICSMTAWQVHVLDSLGASVDEMRALHPKVTERGVQDLLAFIREGKDQDGTSVSSSIAKHLRDTNYDDLRKRLRELREKNANRYEITVPDEGVNYACVKGYPELVAWQVAILKNEDATGPELGELFARIPLESIECLRRYVDAHRAEIHEDEIKQTWPNYFADIQNRLKELRARTYIWVGSP